MFQYVEGFLSLKDGITRKCSKNGPKVAVLVLVRALYSQGLIGVSPILTERLIES